MATETNTTNTETNTLRGNPKVQIVSTLTTNNFNISLFDTNCFLSDSCLLSASFEKRQVFIYFLRPDLVLPFSLIDESDEAIVLVIQ